ncbi:MAG TPA: MarR family transcriptional regulator [Succinivibrionaceae bacterium]|nr:MarR family transcriptional regulator [Succinivibrionaceae bacterium]
MSTDKYSKLRINQQLCFPLYAAAKEVIKKYRPYLEPLGLTYTQYIAMMVLWEDQKINVKDLGKKLFLDSGTLTPMLKKMEQKGWIKRETSREDERVTFAIITKEGMELQEKALSIPNSMQSCINLDPKLAAELYQRLYQLLDNFKTAEKQKKEK